MPANPSPQEKPPWWARTFVGLIMGGTDAIFVALVIHWWGLNAGVIAATFALSSSGARYAFVTHSLLEGK